MHRGKSKTNRLSVPAVSEPERPFAITPRIPGRALLPPSADVFAHIYEDLPTGRRALNDTLTILRQMRSMLRLPATVYAALNAMLVVYAQDKRQAVVEEWLSYFPELKID